MTYALAIAAAEADAAMYRNAVLIENHKDKAIELVVSEGGFNHLVARYPYKQMVWR